MKPRSALRCLLGISFAMSILSGPASAAVAHGSPIVRVTVTPEEVSVGAPVTLQVTVLAPTWFPRPPRYPSFELANTITRLPPDSSYPTNERIGGESWSGIIRRYQVYPLVSASYRLTGRTMTVTYAHPQSFRPDTVEVEVPDIEFRAVVPAGARSLDPYLAGASLRLEREIEGDLASLQAGDALVVQHTAVLDGMPAIFLPAITGPIEIPGVSVYRDEPTVEDAPGGGGRARRSERLTLVFESGGDFTVPGIELRWWNTRSEEVERASVPAFNVSVAGPVATADGEARSAAGSAHISLATIMSVVAGLAVGMVLLARWVPGLWRRWRAGQQRRRESEAYAFARLRTALRSGDQRAAHHAWLTWLARLSPGIDGETFVRLYGGAELRAEARQLSRSLYSGAALSTDLRPLAASLAAARRAYRRQLAGSKPSALPLLNP